MFKNLKKYFFLEKNTDLNKINQILHFYYYLVLLILNLNMFNKILK